MRYPWGQIVLSSQLWKSDQLMVRFAFQASGLARTTKLLFQAFSKPASTTQIWRTGLGLVICQRCQTHNKKWARVNGQGTLAVSFVFNVL
jgi:light-regulated signal transduction histidine kinase (bacteriophytochrome)